jgi:hypothetical protein
MGACTPHSGEKQAVISEHWVHTIGSGAGNVVTDQVHDCFTTAVIDVETQGYDP